MFNQNSRLKNTALASFAGIGYQLIKIVLTFVYRTVFLLVFAKEYLGINGLFTNILQILSLTELGIGTAILYRMYKPFVQQDVPQIGALLDFYKNVYRIIAAVVIGLSLLVYQLLPVLVNVEEIPADVNVTVVYFLFVGQSIASYFCAYKQSVISADQRGYMVSFYQLASELAVNAVRIAAIFLTRDYVLVLAVGIVVTVAFNFGFGAYISSQYREIFRQKKKLDRQTKKTILFDTGSLLCHKVGTVVVSATDSLVLAKFVSLVSVGLYSNYSLIVNAILGTLVNVSGSLNPIVGNYATVSSKEDTYKLYIRCTWLGFWISSCLTVCLFTLLNVFIEAWLDGSYLFQPGVVAVLCLQFYLQCSRIVNNIFINGCGLFMKDKLRPLVESAVNLAVSVILAAKYGIIGVFIGTCVSAACTYYWREPYLLLRYYFGKSGWKYTAIAVLWLAITVAACGLFTFINSYFPSGWLGFLLRGVVTLLGTNGLYVLFMHKTDFFRSFRTLLLKKAKS